MSEFLAKETFLILADLLVLLPVVLGLYILALAPRERANQAVGGYVLLLAAINIGEALGLHATDVASALLPLRIIATLFPIISVATFFIVIYLFRPDLLRGKHRRWRILLWVLISLPVILMLVDIALGRQIYFTPPATWQPGVVPNASVFIATPLGTLIRITYTFVTQSAVLILLIWLIWRADLTPRQRNLAWALLGLQILSGLTHSLALITPWLNVSWVMLITGTLYALVCVVVAYRQEFIGSTVRHVRMQPLISSLILVVVLPMIAFLTLSANGLVYKLARINADTHLQDLGNLTATQVEQWLNFNIEALRKVAAQEEIRSLDPERQKPLLRTMDLAHDYMYLVSTTDVLGRNIARSDDVAPKDYNDRLWFQNALRGQSPSLQVLIGRTSQKPALVVATPIRNAADNIIGVAMFASTLDDLTKTVLNARVGENGYAYLVDQSGTLLAHPNMLDAELTQLEDYSREAPVVTLLQTREHTWLTYTDANGITWRAYVVPLENGWGLVVQQPESEILASAQIFTNLSIGVMVLIGIVLFALVWVSIRQFVAPVELLTATAQAIAAGHFEQRAPEASKDELGILGGALNLMANRLQEAIQDLEKRVAERTSDLARRSEQLQAIAETNKAISTVQTLETLLPLITQRISQHFGFYHVGIFLLDEQGEYAILRAANSTGGQRMLARRHRLRVGMQGLVGYAAFTRQARIARDVGADAIHFDNPDLPDTRSEAAFPLVIGERVLGVLDAQSTKPDAFQEDDVAILELLADQVAVAIENARLIEESQRLAEEQRATLGQFDRRAWQRQMEMLASPVVRREVTGLRLLPGNGASPEGEIPPEGRVDPQNPRLFHIPLRVRDLTIGSLQARKPDDQPPWSPSEITFLQVLSTELGQALDSARQAQETRLSAWQQQITIETAAQLRQNLDLENILRTTVTQIQQALNLPEVQVQIGNLSEVTHDKA